MWRAKFTLIFCLGLVSCRPQDQTPTNTKNEESDSNVEIERQLIHEVTPSSNVGLLSNTDSFPHRKIDSSTREILEKIAEVNRKQGFIDRKPKPHYFHFPFSYSKAQEKQQKSNNFKFSRNPFTNPVFEYLENEKERSTKENNIPTFRKPNSESLEYPKNYIISMTDPNAEVTPDDQIPGQYIKRKITHYQGFLMPNPYMLNPYNIDPSQQNSIYANSQLPTNLYSFPSQQAEYSRYNIPPVAPTAAETENRTRTNLEKMTVEHVKNIVSKDNSNYNFLNFYYPNVPIGYQNNNQGPDFSSLNLVSSVLPDNSPKKQPPNSVHQNLQNDYRILSRQTNKARQGWNWPGSGLFPIYIRDPFLQMYYAVTNMIEYGPDSGNEGPCKLTPRPQGSRLKVSPKTSSNINEESHKVSLEINKETGSENIEVSKSDDSDYMDNLRYLDVEDIDVGTDNLVKFTINLPKSDPTEGRELKDNIKSDEVRWNKIFNISHKDTTVQAPGKFDALYGTLPGKQSTPIRDHILHVEELEDDAIESEKSDDISVSNQGTKKVFSRENTGNGIFIHKLKVRQGGVAIAGPGGIATAGSGGTAIVGPNGIAYTHPDGLAIAGSGTQVVAVDPNIDLNEVIKDSVMNGTRHIPNTRLGKVVAVGPVVYYNRG